MFPDHLKYLHDTDIVWFNPCWGIYGFWKRFDQFQNEKKLDIDSAWNHRDMKSNKEKYVVALAAFCMKFDAPEKNGWWFTKTKEDPPDGLIGTIRNDEKTGANLMSVREVEIVEHFCGSLEETICTKLHGKHYQKDTILICLLSPQTMEISDFQRISRNLITKKMSLNHIFVIFHGPLIPKNWKLLSDEEKLHKLSEISFVQLSPQFSYTGFSPIKGCENFLAGNEGAWLKFEGRGLKGGFRSATIDKAPILFD